jgi:two-component system sensor histidine kinase YesM
MSTRHFFKHIKIKKIQTEITFAFLFLILLTALLIGLLSYRMWMNSEEKNSRQYTLQLIQQVNVNISSYISYMENVSQLVLNNSDVKSYLSSDSDNLSQKAAYESKIAEQFSSILKVRKDISNIVILGSNGNVVLNNSNLKLNPYNDPYSQDWYKKAIAANGTPVISSSHVQNIIKDDYRWVVSLSRSITDSNGKSSGVLLVDLNYSVINDMCSKINLGSRGYIFIVDNQGNIIYHPQQQLIYSNLKTEATGKVIKTKSNYFVTNDNGESKMYTIINSDSAGWKIVGVAYTDELTPDIKQLQMYFFIGIFLLLVMAFIISIFISYRISKPIKILEFSMKEVEKGNFDIKTNIQNSNEVGKLGKTFNLMTSKIKELIEQNTIEQELKRKSELKALQTQINPHFLYNTLDSIIWMAEDKKFDEVVLMTSSLAKLFRLSISSGDELITIFNEIEHIKSYLTIQKMRYLDKLDFEIDVDKDIMNYKVLKILLQPLVENSIYHGIKNKDGDGLIRITGEKAEGKLLIKVIDNGIGMSSEQLETIFEHHQKPKNSSGVGVNNVNERIKLYFGNQYGLCYESEIGVGTTVSITLPVVK